MSKSDSVASADSAVAAVDPAKIAAAFAVVESTALALDTARQANQLALKELKNTTHTSTFNVEGAYYQIRERTGTGMYLCKLEGPPKGRGKKKAAAAAEATLDAALKDLNESTVESASGGTEDSETPSGSAT
jgi:hypothetical protein